MFPNTVNKKYHVACKYGVREGSTQSLGFSDPRDVRIKSSDNRMLMPYQNRVQCHEHLTSCTVETMDNDRPSKRIKPSSKWVACLKFPVCVGEFSPNPYPETTFILLKQMQRQLVAMYDDHEVVICTANLRGSRGNTNLFGDLAEFEDPNKVVRFSLQIPFHQGFSSRCVHGLRNCVCPPKHAWLQSSVVMWIDEARATENPQLIHLQMLYMLDSMKRTSAPIPLQHYMLPQPVSDMSVEDIPVVKITPYRHQLDTLAWVKSIERKVSDGSHCLPLTGVNRVQIGDLLLNISNGSFYKRKQSSIKHHAQLRGGIIESLPGFGKTLTMLMVAASCSRKDGPGTLVIVPRHKLHDWMHQVDMFMDSSVTVLKIDNAVDFRKATWELIRTSRLVFITYEFLLHSRLESAHKNNQRQLANQLKDVFNSTVMDKYEYSEEIASVLAEYVQSCPADVLDNLSVHPLLVPWQRLVVDDAHLNVCGALLKTTDTRSTQLIHSIPSKFRWLMTSNSHPYRLASRGFGFLVKDIRQVGGQKTPSTSVIQNMFDLAFRVDRLYPTSIRFYDHSVLISDEEIEMLQNMNETKRKLNGLLSKKKSKQLRPLPKATILDTYERLTASVKDEMQACSASELEYIRKVEQYHALFAEMEPLCEQEQNEDALQLLHDERDRVGYDLQEAMDAAEDAACEYNVVEHRNHHITQTRDILIQNPGNHECPVCMEKGKSVVVLWCGHAVCGVCTQNMLADKSHVECPVCRHATDKENVFESVEHLSDDEKPDTPAPPSCVSKIDALTLLCEKAIQKGERLIVASQWETPIRFVEQALSDADISVAVLPAGPLNIRTRNRMSLEISEGDMDVLLMDMTSSCEESAVDMTCFNHVVFLHPVYGAPRWVKRTVDRLLGMVCRLGQTKPVTMHTLVAETSMEKNLMQAQNDVLTKYCVNYSGLVS